MAALLLCGASLAQAQPSDTVFKVARDGYSIAALVSHLPEMKAPTYAVLLFPGHPGILKLSDEGGAPSYEQRGNFLVRSRHQWLDAQTLVAVVDAPSDQWRDFSQHFRSSERYGEDIGALVDALARRYSVEDFTFVGTSEGSVSAFHAARMNARRAKRVILSASVFVPSRNGPGLAAVDWKALSSPLLWVHHEDDPCEYTAYSYARRYAQATASPLVTVHGGGPGRGRACEAFTAHGFVGVERETVLAMRAWVKTGSAPADVAP